MYKVALIASAIVLVGCTGKVAPSGAALANTQWVLSGFESTIGINSPPNRYITLGFNADNKLNGMVGCYAIQGEYSNQDNLISIKASEGQIPSTCIKGQQEAEFLVQLNAAKSYTSTGKILAFQLADGRRLNFVQKFPGCASPLPISGNPSSQVEITTFTISDDLIAQYEHSNPDFTLTTAAQSCSASIVAAVNPNTLLQLQCDSSVATLAYK